MDFFKHRINKIAVKLAGTSCCIGNLLFLLYLAFPNEHLIGFGIIYVLLTVLANGIVFLGQALNTLLHLKDLEEHITAMVLATLNIPVAGLYLSLLNI